MQPAQSISTHKEFRHPLASLEGGPLPLLESWYFWVVRDFVSCRKVKRGLANGRSGAFFYPHECYRVWGSGIVGKMRTHEGNLPTRQPVVQSCIITASNTGHGNRTEPVKSIRRKYISVHCSLIPVTEGSQELSVSSGQDSSKDRWRNCAQCHFVHFKRHTYWPGMEPDLRGADRRVTARAKARSFED
jgi:hypothetical protein